MRRLTPIGPFPGGANSFYIDSTHTVFQVAGKNDPPPQLRAATNVDIDDDGWVRRRDGLTERISTTSAQTIFPFNTEGLILLHEDTELKSSDPDNFPTTSTLDTGLSASVPLTFCEHAGQVFYTDGTVKARIQGGAKKNWGCALGPTPTLTQTGGSLEPGYYQVAVEPIDANGIRHAADKAKTIILAATGGISVAVSGVDSDTTHLRVYVAGPDDDVLFMKGDVAIGSFPYTITILPTEDTVCKTIGLSPPPTHDFAFSLQDRLMLVKDSYIYPSFGAATHLYDLPRHQVGRPENILAAASVAAPGASPGFWTVSSKGAYWADGDTPVQWRQWDLKHSCEFCVGSITVNSSALPWLELSGAAPVALFMSSWGLAVGLSGGQMLFPYRSQQNETVSDKRVSFGLVEKSGLYQLIYTIS